MTCRKYSSGALCSACGKTVKRAGESKEEEEWVAVGPKGQRDVRELADPVTNTGRWSFVHVKCMQAQGHAKCHPDCARPNGPCTDWHLRGKCKRGFDCGHCHFKHPELLEKYPELPPGGVLRRPQRRERLAMLKSAYEDEIKKYLQGDPCEQGVKSFLAGSITLGAAAEAAFRNAISQLEEEEQMEKIDSWKDLIEQHEPLTEFRKKFVQEAEAEGKGFGAGDYIKRVLDKPEAFSEVVNRVTADDRKDYSATLDDILDYLCDARGLENFVLRFEEIVDL